MNNSVLISGAGIAGPTLAFWLKAAGFQPTLIEQARALRVGGYVVDFWGLGYDIAEQMHLTDDINRIGYHAREMRVVDDLGKRIAGFGTRVFDELTNGRYVTIGRSDLSRLLFERLRDDTEVIFQSEILALQERDDCVEVQLKNAGTRRFGLVIGADGLHSTVRRLTFGPQSRFEKYLGYAVAAFEVRGYRPRDEDIYLMYGQPGRMLGRFTLHDDRTLFLFVFAADSDTLPEGLERQKAMLRERYREKLS
ncbi:FAD-dependent monooxygenase [Bradyrhizobium sp. RT4b]|uniref:FAD-dependent monooxygenase n=1 Tax=unclassified Bradyrhizobium TaxID=2631580 RepID=UPI0033960BF4